MDRVILVPVARPTGTMGLGKLEDVVESRIARN